MFKLFKRKLVREVVRVEDLQVGDIVQYDLVTTARVKSIVIAKTQLIASDAEYKILFEDVTYWSIHKRTWTCEFFGSMKIFVLR